MDPIKELQALLPQIEANIGYTFKDKSLLTLAFVHRSFVNEYRHLTEEHNERLEFLGDSILGMLISEYLYKNLPDTPEGDLSYLRSRLVEASSCVSYVQALDVEKYLLLGKGERRNDGRGRETILADLFEALVGAIYLDGGLLSAKEFLFKNFSKEIEAILSKPIQNWKALLQDFTQKRHQKAPIYKVISATGPEHSKEFVISVFVNEQEIGTGKGNSKKEAQQAAAADALIRYGHPEAKGSSWQR